MTWLLFVSLAVAADAPDSVDMDLQRFLDLYEKSRERREEPPQAPRAWTINSVRYDGTVILDDGEPVSAVFVARARVEALDRKNWVRVPLLPAKVALQQARIGSADAPMYIENGWYTLVTDRKGPIDVELRFAVSVSSKVGTSGFSFDLAPSAGTTMSLTVPAGDALDFTVANAQLSTDRTVGGARVVEATLPATGALSVSWQREIKRAEDEKQAPRVYAEVQTLVGVGDGLLRATATVNQTILFSGVNEVKLRVPAQMTVLDVRGAGIRDWRLGDDQVLDVDLNYAAEGAYTLQVDLEQVIGVGSRAIDAPVVVPLGVERSKGWVGVEVLGNLEVAASDVANATPVDVRTLPAAILGVTTNPVLLGYKYLGADVKIPLRIAQHEDVDVLVTVVDQALARTMFTADGRRLTSVTYQVRNNRRQYLRLAMPEGAELWSASVAAKAVQPARASDGQLLVPLVRSQAAGGALAAFAVEVVYVESGTAPSATGTGTFRAELPRLDVPTTYVGWTVFAPEDAKIRKRSLEGSLRDVEGLSMPLGAAGLTTIETVTPMVEEDARAQVAHGGLGQGAAPVPVRLPLEGHALYFEKLLALDEPLWVAFGYRGLN